MFKATLVVLGSLTMVGCASITGSKNQPVSVSAVCEGNVVNSAMCILTNDKGQWFVQTPGSVVIQKAYGDLAITCKKEGMNGTAVFQSNSTGATWGNIVAGGLIGYAVDASTGSGFDYSPNMTIVMTGNCTADATKRLSVSSQGGLPPDAPASGQTGASAADRLMKLKELFDQNLMTKEEYENRRKTILDGL